MEKKHPEARQAHDLEPSEARDGTPSQVDKTFVWFLRVMAVLMIVLVVDMTIHNFYLMSTLSNL